MHMEPSRPLDLTNSEKLPRFGHPIAAGKVDGSPYAAAGPCAQHRARQSTAPPRRCAVHMIAA